MLTSRFIPGQRWISNTESELGLGIVVDNADRRVTLSFPAVGEQRTYASDNAPLSRVYYPVGDQVTSADGLSIKITERVEKDGCIIYIGVDSAGGAATIEEIDLDSCVQFNKPQDRLFAGQIDKNSSFQLRVETLAHLHRQRQMPTFGLLGPRVQLLPHQLYIAYQVSQRHAPRVLLADEVGLGKTIEAGLILHRQLLSGLARRVLIVVPDSLVHQWLVEMLRRFNLVFTILDEAVCSAMQESDDANPFDSAQLVLCSLSFLVDNPARHAEALTVEWDFLVVDEAHHLSWSETQVSPAYVCIDALAREVRGLLLLTATPEQLGVDGHFARLRLLDPDRYYDLEKFRAEEAGYGDVSELVQQLLSEGAEKQLRENPALCDRLRRYVGEAPVSELGAAADSGDAAGAIERIVDSLLDRHGTGRVLFRNTRDAVAGFPERRLHAHPLAAPAGYSERAAGASLEDLLRPEGLLGNAWLGIDPRVDWLAAWLGEHRREKILVICSQADTARMLEEHLRVRRGVRSSVFHEGLSLVVRDRAAAYFAEVDEGAQVLICSEIGSEGRNFQFSRHLVLFDLPPDPDLLEQRIGRLDRIGQKHTVHIHVPYYQASAQACLLRWYHEGIHAFERACAAGQSVFRGFAEPLRYCLTNSQDAAALDTLIQQTRQRTDQIMRELQLGRDRLLELNSCNMRRALKIVEWVGASTHRLALSDYMECVFDLFGVEQQAHSAESVVLHPGDHMICHSFPGLPEDGVTATYQRAQALVREDMEFLTWEHPIVSGAMDMVLNGEFGNTAFCTLKLLTLKPGTLLLEAIFNVYCPAPRELQLFRYLPQAAVRVVVDIDNNDLTEVLAEKRINHLAERVPKRTAQEIVRHARTEITRLIEGAKRLANVQQADIIRQAMERMENDQAAELGRLRALATVNPNIRSDEIEHLEWSIEQQRQHLQGAQLRLDAIRVALST